ncbi:GTP binding domain [Trypanosoma melophagium]|uniref:GTP binding domain n=1 Tax=Trypanosoma melophagium TaxID=715481 RepID=UPI00351A8A37|nr:GTP binding domain [Trypanosoma melophagium]
MWCTRHFLQRGTPAASLTESSLTQHLTTKNIRRPKKLQREMFLERLKKRRRARAKLIASQEVAQKTTMNTSHMNGRDVIMAQLADEIFSRGHKHICCATNISFVPDGNPATPEVAFAGRGNVGKTSLLRSLFRASREVGRSNVKLRRDAMNFFNVGGGIFNIVDLPGFGGTSVPWSTVLQHAILLRNFVQYRPSLKMLYYCMDVHFKHGVYIQDIDMLRFLSKEVPNFTIVLTKGDQISMTNSNNLLRLEDVRKELLFHDITHPVLVTSAYHMGGIDALRFDMVMNCMHALPTERLTITEAKRLSERLLSRRELSTVRQLSLPPTQLQEDLQSWEAELQEERAMESLQHLNSSGTMEEEKEEKNANDKEELQISIKPRNDESSSGISTSDGVEIDKNESKDISSLTEVKTLTTSIAIHHSDAAVAFNSLRKKVTNKALMNYVQKTSPWRNPLLWPENVVPTKHPKANIMRCPEDPHNPYLTQAHFVCPRADMFFRRPNVGLRKASKKGIYEADRPLAFLLKQYTIPYFPDIVDVNMHPLPWTFLGSREAYYERSGGRQLGVRMRNYVTKGEIRPLADNPAPTQPDLTRELQALEKARYGSPIAMLRPPEKSNKSINENALTEK